MLQRDSRKIQSRRHARVPTGASWEFDRFTLLQVTRLLASDGMSVPLTSKAFDTLVVLVDNRDRIVTKDERRP